MHPCCLALTNDQVTMALCDQLVVTIIIAVIVQVRKMFILDLSIAHASSYFLLWKFETFFLFNIPESGCM